MLERLRLALPHGRSLPDDAWSARHKGLLVVLWAHVVGIFVLGVGLGYGPGHSAIEAAMIGAFALPATLGRRLGRKLAGTFVSAGLLTSSALVVHLTHGTIESHFHFFVVMALLLLYEDWVPFSIAVAFVLVHHGLLGQFAPGSVFNHADAVGSPWMWAGIHAGFVAAASAANIAAWRMNEAVRARLVNVEASVAESERRLRGAFDEAPIGVGFTSIDGQWLHVNDALCRMLGRSAAELCGRTFADVVHADDREADRKALTALAGGRIAAYQIETRLVDAEGGFVPTLANVSLARCDAGDPMYVIRQMQDITERRHATEALVVSENRFSSLVSNLPGAVYRSYVVDGEGVVDFVSDGIEAICGYPASDFMTGVRTSASIVHDDDAGRVLRAVKSARARGVRYAIEYRIHHADGGERWVYEQGQPAGTDDGARTWIDGFLFDITERKRAEDAFERQAELNRYQALHDALTGLPNRTLFHDRIGDAIRDARRAARSFAVVMMDLDRFKDINDTLGHHCGDLLLQEIGKRLKEATRESDTVCRLGGDEFGLLLKDTTDVGPTLDRIRAAIEETMVVQGLPLSAEISMGIALFPEHGADADVLLQRADVAMYVAKEEGASRVAYDPAQDAHDPGRLTLIGELKRALTERELVVYYQPKAHLRTRRVEGVEALVRWKHPERGLVPPDSFIPLAQQTGLIKPLTLYVIDEALRQSREWVRLGHELPVAVNVSPRTLLDADFPADVELLLDRWDVDARLLEFEITESTLVADPFRAKAVIDRLDAMGIRMSVDDFGTGYSSLAYLKRLPVRDIKIDRSFIVNMLGDAEDHAIVRSTIELGRNLGLRVIAEGVESEEVWERLRDLGCDIAQGFLLSRPVPADELTRWLAGAASRPAAAALTAV